MTAIGIVSSNAKTFGSSASATSMIPMVYPTLRAATPVNVEQAVSAAPGGTDGGHVGSVAGLRGRPATGAAGLPAGPERAPADDPQLSLAVDHFERAYELAGTGDSRRQTYAVHAMRGAFATGRHADARHYAERVLDACGACDGWRRADAQHQVNIVLGRVALAEADVASAREHLLAAGRVEGSPVLGSFGPNMALAKELLERGERDAVLEYLGLCSRFWDRKRLGVWAGVVRAGRTPDFGSNLIY